MSYDLIDTVSDTPLYDYKFPFSGSFQILPATFDVIDWDCDGSGGGFYPNHGAAERDFPVSRPRFTSDKFHKLFPLPN